VGGSKKNPTAGAGGIRGSKVLTGQNRFSVGFAAFNQLAVNGLSSMAQSASQVVCLPGKRSRALSRHTRLSGDTQFSLRPGALWPDRYSIKSTSTLRSRLERLHASLELHHCTIGADPS